MGWDRTEMTRSSLDLGSGLFYDNGAAGMVWRYLNQPPRSILSTRPFLCHDRRNWSLGACVVQVTRSSCIKRRDQEPQQEQWWVHILTDKAQELWARGGTLPDHFSQCVSSSTRQFSQGQTTDSTEPIESKPGLGSLPPRTTQHQVSIAVQ